MNANGLNWIKWNNNNNKSTISVLKRHTEKWIFFRKEEITRGKKTYLQNYDSFEVSYFLTISVVKSKWLHISPLFARKPTSLNVWAQYVTLPISIRINKCTHTMSYIVEWSVSSHTSSSSTASLTSSARIKSERMSQQEQKSQSLARERGTESGQWVRERGRQRMKFKWES